MNIHADLINRCRSQDPSAQYELYKLYSKAMYNTALRITGNSEDAEDALQEGFLSAFRNINSYREEAAFGAWLKRIIVNKSITLWNKRKVKMETGLDDQFDLPEIESEEPQYDVSAIKAAMVELPDGFRNVLSLYLLEGYDHSEIAEIMGITESTSKTQYKRAKERLRTILTSKQQEYGSA